MFDIGGYLTSMEFLSQIAALVTALLSALVGTWIGGLFGTV